MRGQTKFVLAGTNFCLDATQQNPPNGIKMKIWECFVDLPQQDWFYTDDNRIALTNQGECLDLTNGNLTNFNPLQVWACTTGNTNHNVVSPCAAQAEIPSIGVSQIVPLMLPTPEQQQTVHCSQVARPDASRPVDLGSHMLAEDPLQGVLRHDLKKIKEDQKKIKEDQKKIKAKEGNSEEIV
ncbi:hypothetical protein EHS25_000649 [Saitozyma podzolica]|uniref:Ricin B lectin domain-containing protein n=1 Tax=Saitozyma podzolica TaxID=1890683 RepID=A0A427YWS7_9TREE|nr:hypothetical protein EHS25_000649 [Saitozyma podzolica]